MKKNKRFFLKTISVVLALVMSLSTVVTVTAQEEQYPVTADVINRAELLAALEISQIAGIGISEWSGDLTRGEAAFLIAGLVGLPRERKESVYNDINLNAYYAGSVASLYEAGIVLKEWGSMKYKPEQPILYIEFVAMICKALGYAGYAESKGGYPLGYVSVARQFKITPGAAPTNKNIDKTLVPEIIMRALDANYLGVVSVDGAGNVDSQKKGKVLEDYFDVKTYEGLVEEVGYYSMTGNFQAIGGKITIGGINFYISGKEMDYEKYVGQYATVYYTGEKQVVGVYPDASNNAVTIDALDLCPYGGSANYVEYYDEEDEKQEIDLELGYVTLYNGVKTSSFTVPTYGNVTFIDNDDDGKAEVVKVREYVLSKVKAFDTVNNTFTIVDTNGNDIVISGDDTDRYKITNNKTGKEVKAVALEKDEKIIYSASVPRTASNSTYDIILLKNTVEGKITAFTSDEIAIDGVYYPQSGLLTIGGATLGNEATLYLDSDGKAICLEAVGYNYLDMKYAVITDFDEERVESGKEWFVEMFTQDNVLVEIPLADKVKINGVKYIKENDTDLNTIKTKINDMITASSSSIVLIKYKSSGGKLTELLTTEGNDWGNVFKPWEFGNGFNQYTPADTLRWRLGSGGQFNSSIYLAKDALRVFIQFDNGKIDTKYSQFTVARMLDDKDSNVTFFDIDKSGMPHAYIVNSGVDDSLKTKETASDNASLLGITKVVDGADDEGELCKYIFGLMKGVEVEFYVTMEDYEAKSVLRDSLKPGNLVRIMTQGKKITDLTSCRRGSSQDGVRVWYSKAQLTNPTFSTTAAPGYYDINAFEPHTRNRYHMIGKVISVEDGYVTFSSEPNIKNALSNGTKYIIKLAVGGNVTKFDATASVPFAQGSWKDVRSSTNVTDTNFSGGTAEFDGSTVIFNVSGYSIAEIIILD